MIELDFMPHDLSSHPETGPNESWRYPPKDYTKWRELNLEFAEHLINRYGNAEVRTWYFSTWNEADIYYFKHRPDENLDDPEQKKKRDEEFFKVHDYAVDGIWAVDDKLIIGGPDLACDIGFLDRFLAHCHDGENYATGNKGSRLDFISLHCKGTSMDKNHRVPDPDYDDIARRRFLKYWSVIKKYPRFKELPIIANEWDIDVGTVLGIHDSNDWQFRNNSYYPTFVIRSIKDINDLIIKEGINIELIMQWAFYFHGKRCFEGHRAIFDPFGIRKPIFNGFEMLSYMGQKRVQAITDDKEVDLDKNINTENKAETSEWDKVNPHPQVDALATKTNEGLQVLVWNQVCDQYKKGARNIEIEIEGLKNWKTARIVHYRIDEEHSNANTVWKKLGCPDWPTDSEIKLIKEKEKLEKFQPDSKVAIINKTIRLRVCLPVHSVSLFIVKGEDN